MDKIKLQFSFSDKEYVKALEKAFCLRYENIEIDHINPEITVDENIVPPFQPVQAIYSQTMAILKRPTGPAKPQEFVKYTAFTSGVGGGGLTTTAICYAKLCARIFNRKTGFISFDPWFRQQFPDNDEFGVRYFKSWPIEEDIDELVLDIPYGIPSFRDYLDMSEVRIVIKGFDDKRKAISNQLFFELCESAKEYIVSPKTFCFDNKYEDNADPSDIHGQLGKEMLEFVKQLESEQTET